MQKKNFDIQYVLDKLNLTLEELDKLSDTGPVIDVKSHVKSSKDVINPISLMFRERERERERES